jgi:hypothetical protein
MNFMAALLAAPPEFTHCTFHLVADAFRDEKTAHHVGRDSLDNSTDKNTSTSKR